MRADADATERSGGIGRNDTSSLCVQSTCMALGGDNTGDAFSALIAFIWTPPDVQGLFGVMSEQIRLQVYIRPVLQTEACGP